MWEPIADPKTAARCWRAIDEIENDLVERLSAQDGMGLAGGSTGLALFFSYLAAAREGSSASDHGWQALHRSIAALGTAHPLPSLYGGFCGVGWMVEHLTREHFEADDDLCADLDEALRLVLAAPSPGLKYELINGLSGFGVYLVERLPRPGAAELLGRILDLLEDTAEWSENGVTWFTPPAWVPSAQRDWMPEGGYNLGVAHGVPGVLGFLAAARSGGLEDPRLDRLSEGAVAWLLAQRHPAEEGSVYSSAVVPGKAPAQGRTAWCYGDLGIAAVLLCAARAFARPEWEAEALALARLAARRPRDSFRSVDACLCHGSAGNAHLFNRIHQTTGDPEIREAALAWYRHALDTHRSGEGVGGFLTWSAIAPGELTWRGEPGFLMGGAGIGLALLAAVAEADPAWDRVMLLSLPPRSSSSEPAPVP